MATEVSAVYGTRASAADAVESLLKGGFTPNDISLMMSEATRGRDFAIDVETKAPEGAAAGAAIGGVLGGIGAALVSTGILAAPGLGLLAAGPLVASLAGVGAGGAVGGLSGALVGMGVPEHEAKIVNDELKEGAILIGVRSHDEEVKNAKNVFTNTGGKHIRTFSS